MHVVVGAGPAGLATAWGLRRAGHEVLVLEAGDRVGGMAASLDVGGVRVDLGSHRLHPSTPPDLLAELSSMVRLQRRPRNGRIRMAGSWVPFPFGPVGLLRGLPAGLAARAARDAAVGPLRARLAGEPASYADVVRTGLGSTVWRAFHEPYAWKLWDTDPAALSPELARRRVSAATAGAVARRVVAGARTRPTFWYPEDGFGAIAEALADRVPVETGRRVTRLLPHDDRIIVGCSDGRVVTASHVWATAPATAVDGWLRAGAGDADPRRTPGPVPEPPPVRAMVLVYLVLDRRPYTPFDAHYLPERHVLPTRLSEPTNYRDRAADPRGRTVLCAEIPCWPGDEVHTAPADALATRVADDLVRCGLPDPRPVGVHVERLGSVYPVLTPEALAAQDELEARLATVARLTVLGRQGLATPDNTHHVLQMGLAAAGTVRPDGVVDAAAWREARDGFRAFVVED